MLWFNPTQRYHVNVSPAEGGRETRRPWQQDMLFSQLDVEFDSKFFLTLICGKMAQIMCCTLDVFTCDETWQTLLVPLLDILKVMYIKAELFLFWLGRCQHTFIWSARDGGFSLNQTDGKMWLEALCAYKVKGNLKQIIWVTQMEKKKPKQLVMNRENVRVEIGTHCSWEELHLSQVLVTTQMICRYYWNLGIEQQTRDQMKDVDAKTDKAEAGRRK